MPAPVVLFVYNRPTHARATIEALSRNTLAPQTDLIIFSDGPKDDAAHLAVLEVRTLIADIHGFATVRVNLRERHLGLARSVITGVSDVMADAEAVIVLEDDLSTTPMFLAYMNAALDHYRRDPKAFSIGGFQFPRRMMPIPEDYRWDTYASYRCCSWGWATWKDRWERVDWSMSYFDDLMARPEQQEGFNRGGPDLTGMLSGQHEGRIDSWAIRFCYAHFATDTHCIYPTRSLVENIGLDNSGTHSGVNRRLQHGALDAQWLPQRFCPADPVDPELASRFRRAFLPMRRRSIAAVLRYAQRKTLGLIGRPVRQPAQKVDVLVVNTFQNSGGAARAAYRAFLGVKGVYSKAHYLTLVKEDPRPDISGHLHRSLKGRFAIRLTALDRIPMARYSRRRSTAFSPAVRPNPLRVPLTRFEPQLVHLHWVTSGLLRPEDLAQLRVPVVWTLHDAWAFTGGCHHPGTCEGFLRQCGACPQLASAQEHDLSRSLWHRKSVAFSRIDLTAVAPSRWLAGLARQSSLLAGRRVEVIPNGLDTDVFRPVDKMAARARLGIRHTHPIFVFGAQRLTNHGKGGDLLCDALAQLDFPCTLLTFGDGRLPMRTGDRVTVHSLGTIRDDARLALVYAAADAFVCPSREDNLPNTVAEALACGTPCIAFDACGLPDMIDHQQTGWLARPFDPVDLAAGMRWVAGHAHPDRLRSAARQKALADYSLPVMTRRYAKLYEELLTPGQHWVQR